MSRPSRGRPCPSAPRGERGQRGLEVDEHARDRLGVARPREVQGDAGLAVLRAHPQLVGGDGADLARPAAPGAASRPARGRRGSPRRRAPRHVVLGLDLLAVAGGEAHAEVRQAIRPRPGDAELRRAVDGIEAEDRVAVDRRGDGAEELLALLLGRVGDAALDPHLVDRLAPAGEDADAVAGGGDLVEVLVQRIPAEPLEHALAHLVGGLDVEGDARHDAQRAEADDEAVEVRLAARHGEDARRRR